MSQTAIVTGSSRGIGRAIATRLAHDGFAVVVNYAGSQAQAEEAVTQIQSAGGQAIAVKAEVSIPADVERLFAETVARFGSVDVVVHNSGIMTMSPIGKGDVETFDRVIATNLRGAYLVHCLQSRRGRPGPRVGQ